jgi:transcriptional regulator with XRE-family HTH domain
VGSFKERLREMMEKRGMRQADLVNATGIERSIISSYVTGRYEPKDEKLQLLASALSCDAMWLAGYDGVDEDDDMAFLERFRKLNVEDKRTILTLLNFMNDHERRNNEGV